MNSDFGEYRLLRLLGEGGMAQVWAARRRSPHGPRRCAVKIIKTSRDEAAQREMFARECRIALALSGHENVVSVLDMGEHRGRDYLAMELIDGVTLAQMARRVEGPWPVAEAVAVTIGVLRALCHVHALEVEGESAAIVHRDVTPHNVMISTRGEVKLVDFGIAQRADAEPRFDQALGKLSYVPREQVEGEPDQRSDLYSAGAVLFELLDGRRFRWHCADEDALFQEIYRNRVPSLRRKDVPAAVSSVLRGLLQPNRQRRLASAAQALHQLEAWMAEQGQAPNLSEFYARTVGPRAPMPEPPVSEQFPSVPRSRSAWEEVSTDEAHSRTSPAANDSGRRATAAAAAEASEAGVVQRRGRSRTVSAPAWGAQSVPSRDVAGEVSPSESARTVIVPAAHRNARSSSPVELMERFVTHRHPAALPEVDVPVARAAAEIAVTEPVPSRRAPWAEGTEPIEHRVVRPEPGAPVMRRRGTSSTSGQYGTHDQTGSVSRRERQSASMHHAASDSDHVSGEIVIDDEPPEVFAVSSWRAGAR